jgi:hypothetical protein
MRGISYIFTYFEGRIRRLKQCSEHHTEPTVPQLARGLLHSCLLLYSTAPGKPVSRGRLHPDAHTSAPCSRVKHTRLTRSNIADSMSALLRLVFPYLRGPMDRAHRLLSPSMLAPVPIGRRATRTRPWRQAHNIRRVIRDQFQCSNSNAGWVVLGASGQQGTAEVRLIPYHSPPPGRHAVLLPIEN